MYYVWYISYMTYTSTVTSKGTITLPAPIRRKLGITEGRKVTFQVHGKTVSVRPESGWDEFFASTEDFGEKAREMIRVAERRPLLTNQDIQQAIATARKQQHRAKF